MKRRGIEWRKTRKHHLAVYPECRICGDTDDVVAHHLRYRGRVGVSERPGDLVTLCDFHHSDLHRTLGRSASLEDQLAFINAHALEHLTDGSYEAARLA